MEINSWLDLCQYIDQIKKAKAGAELSLSDFLAIGIKHRNLPKTEKNWSELTQITNYPNKPETYRKFVAKYSNLGNCSNLNTNIDILNNTSKNPSAFVDDLESLYKEKTKVRDVYNTYRASLRNTARIESFKESIVNAINNLKPLESKGLYQPNYKNANVTEGILMLSDLHLGVNCNNFYNTYNSTVAVNRIEKLCADTIYYCKLNNVEQLNVLNLGDMIHGIIHPTARIQAEFDLTSQIITAAELICNLLNKLKVLNIPIIYRSCVDNHSRVVANKAENIESENFNKIIDWYIEARLSHSGITFAHDNLDDTIGKFKLANGKNVIFAHGHLENVSKCVDTFCTSTKEFIDYVLLSHYHNSREKQYNGSRLIINGSIVGTEEYAFSKRLFSPAEQKLLIFDKRDVNNFIDININLQI